MNNIHLEITSDNMQNIETFSQILHKDINTILNEALEEYFQNTQKKLMEKNLNDENAMTNLDYDEFWDGVDL